MSSQETMYVDDYLDLPTTKKVTSINPETKKETQINEFPNPKIGKVYRNPETEVKSSRIVTITKIIGINQQPVPHFKYAYPPEIKRLHIEVTKLYVSRSK
jgi:hypothetical protein